MLHSSNVNYIDAHTHTHTHTHTQIVLKMIAYHFCFYFYSFSKGQMSLLNCRLLKLEKRSNMRNGPSLLSIILNISSHEKEEDVS